MIREEIKNLTEKAIKELQKEGVFEAPEARLENPEEKSHGDYSTNIALAIAKAIKKNPMEIAENLKSRISKPKPDLFEKIETASPGFINFFLSKEYLQNQVEEILRQKEKFGSLELGNNQKINVEFISANPTGPLHIGNARGGFCGDVLANVLQKAGYKTSREYYVNDRGRQIKILQDALDGKDGYKNEYTDELIRNGEKDVRRAVEFIVRKIKETTKRMGIGFDKWFFETELYDKKVNKILDFLKKEELTYEKEGALWFKSTKFGDDKDRVLIRTVEKTTYEEETYILSDFAYLEDKFDRGFKHLIIFLGAEHHGYVPRLKAAVEALSQSKDRLIPIVFQLVRLVKGDKEVRMSKRGGVYVAIDDLLDEINGDVARFFFLMYSPNTHMNFNMDLAKEQSEKNPVFYIQYAFARICSILRKAEGYKQKGTNSELLNEPSELDLIKQMIRFPEIIEDTAKDYQVQRIPQYALDLVGAFHKFYEKCRVIDEKNKDLTEGRLALVKASQIVLKNTLDLMGISAPEKM